MRSMTGFGRAEGLVGTSFFTIEVKSVNHRYLDARIRLPVPYTMFEIPLNEKLRSLFERGSFEVLVKHRVAPTGGLVASGTRFAVDEAAAQSLHEGLQWLKNKYKLESVPSLDAFTSNNKILVPVEETADGDDVYEGLSELFSKALKDLKKMRENEGGKLKEILRDGLSDLSNIVGQIGEISGEHPKRVREKLDARISQWNLAATVDRQRLELEVALYADKADITEELDRLKTHVDEFVKLLESKKGVGRKLDFMTQELHREINTVSSKAAFIDVTRLTVEAKTLIEKLREQVQNVE